MLQPHPFKHCPGCKGAGTKATLPTLSRLTPFPCTITTEHSGYRACAGTLALIV